MSRWEYCTAWVQSERVTFIDGEWQGALPYEEAMKLGPSWADTCKLQNVVLDELGLIGWELVSVIRDEGKSPYLRLYFKRPL